MKSKWNIIITQQENNMNFYFQISYQQKSSQESEGYKPSFATNYQKMNVSSTKHQTKRPNKKITAKTLRWSHQQHIQYVNFLVKEKLLFQLPLIQKRKVAIHNLMSNSIKTKNSLQCRSHHQKMLIKHKNIENIIKYFAELFQKQGNEKIQVTEEEKSEFAQQMSSSSTLKHANTIPVCFEDLLDYPEMLMCYSQSNEFQKQSSNENDLY